MTIVLTPEQERVVAEAVSSGMAHTPDEAIDQALQALKSRLPGQEGDRSVAEAMRRLATFGKRHGLSLGGMTIKELLHESRP
jgi:GTP cyclohydrolase III